MKIVSLVAQKGGSGKSTLARHIAVAGMQAGLRTAILDCDMQGSLRDWGETRAREPRVVVELSPNQRHLEAKLAAEKSAGTELLVLDTPGGLQTPVPFIVAGLSDLVVVPVRPTDDDLRAFWPLLPRLQGSRVPMIVVLSQCPTTTTGPRVSTEAVLLGEGVPVAPVAIHAKGFVPASGVEGLTVLEMEPTSEAERRTVREFGDLYAFVALSLSKGRR